MAKDKYKQKYKAKYKAKYKNKTKSTEETTEQPPKTDEKPKSESNDSGVGSAMAGAAVGGALAGGANGASGGPLGAVGGAVIGGVGAGITAGISKLVEEKIKDGTAADMLIDAGHTIKTGAKHLYNIPHDRAIEKEAERMKTYKYMPSEELYEQAKKDLMTDIAAGNMLGGEGTIEDMTKQRYMDFLEGRAVPYNEVKHLNADPEWRKKMAEVKTGFVTVVDPQATKVHRNKDMEGRGVLKYLPQRWQDKYLPNWLKKEKDPTRQTKLMTGGNIMKGENIMAKQEHVWYDLDPEGYPIQVPFSPNESYEMNRENTEKSIKAQVNNSKQNVPDFAAQRQAEADKLNAKLVTRSDKRKAKEEELAKLQTGWKEQNDYQKENEFIRTNNQKIRDLRAQAANEKDPKKAKEMRAQANALVDEGKAAVKRRDDFKTKWQKDNEQKEAELKSHIEMLQRKEDSTKQKLDTLDERWKAREGDYKADTANLEQELKDRTETEKPPEPTNTQFEEVTDEKVEKWKEENLKNRPIGEELKEAFAADVSDKAVHKWMGANKTTKLLNKYAGGTSITKLLGSMYDKDTKEFQLGNADLSHLSGALHEGIGGLIQNEEGGLWRPEVAAATNAAKTAFKIANPWLGAAIDVGALALTSPTVRNLIGGGAKFAWNVGSWTADKAWKGTKKVGEGIAWTGGKIRDGVIHLFTGKKPEKKEEPKKEEPAYERPVDLSGAGTNIPNIGVNYESKDDYMKRMTGEEAPVAANVNKVVYTGPRNDNPEHPKMDNMVMLAAPRRVKRKVAKIVKGKRYKRVKKRK